VDPTPPPADSQSGKRAPTPLRLRSRSPPFAGRRASAARGIPLLLPAAAAPPSTVDPNRVRRSSAAGEEEEERAARRKELLSRGGIPRGGVRGGRRWTVGGLGAGPIRRRPMTTTTTTTTTTLPVTGEEEDVRIFLGDKVTRPLTAPPLRLLATARPAPRRREIISLLDVQRTLPRPPGGAWSRGWAADNTWRPPRRTRSCSCRSWTRAGEAGGCDGGPERRFR